MSQRILDLKYKEQNMNKKQFLPRRKNEKI